MKCWGNGYDGQLGQDSQANITQPGSISVSPINLGNNSGSGQPYTAIAIGTGYRHSCAVLDDGKVKCWGHGEFGQLGQGSTDILGDGLYDDDGDSMTALVALPVGTSEMGDSLPAIDLGDDSSGNPYTAKAISTGDNHRLCYSK